MKKIIFLSVALIALTFTACTNSSEEVVTEETTIEVAPVVDEIAIDTIVSDTDTIVAE